MNSRVARLLTSLYPRGWRQRYGEEFEALLAMSRGDLRTLADVAWSAFLEHILSLRGMTMNRLPSSLATISCAYLAVIGAGLNLYATTDDSSLATAMQTHADLSAAWTMIELGSVAALAGAIAMLLPLLAAVLRFALREKRRDILLRLLAAPAGVAIFVAWMAGAFFTLGGHWAPAPWAIAGDWTASADWPPLQMRWAMGSITAGLALVLLVATSICVYQAIGRTRFEGVQFTVLRGRVTVDPLRWARIPGMVTAVAMLVMTVGVLAWGAIANLDAAVAFHGYFGPMHTTAFVSWAGSLCVFALSSAVAVRMLPALHNQAGV